MITERHALELQYFQYLKNMPEDEYRKYSTFSRLRTSDLISPGYINHRTMYLKKIQTEVSGLHFVCMHHQPICSFDLVFDSKIVNMQTGEIIASEKYKPYTQTLLSKRELEILNLLAEGNNSDKNCKLPQYFGLHGSSPQTKYNSENAGNQYNRSFKNSIRHGTC